MGRINGKVRVVDHRRRRPGQHGQITGHPRAPPRLPLEHLHGGGRPQEAPLRAVAAELWRRSHVYDITRARRRGALPASRSNARAGSTLPSTAPAGRPRPRGSKSNKRNWTSSARAWGSRACIFPAGHGCARWRRRQRIHHHDVLRLGLRPAPTITRPLATKTRGVRCFANEFGAKGKSVNSIAPGPTGSPMIGGEPASGIAGGLPQRIPARRPPAPRTSPMPRCGWPRTSAEKPNKCKSTRGG